MDLEFSQRIEAEIERLRRRYTGCLREVPGARLLPAHWTASRRALRWHVVLEEDVLEPDIDVEILPEAVVVRAWIEPAQTTLLSVLPVPAGFDVLHPRVHYEGDYLEILLDRIEAEER